MVATEGVQHGARPRRCVAVPQPGDADALPVAGAEPSRVTFLRRVLVETRCPPRGKECLDMPPRPYMHISALLLAAAFGPPGVAILETNGPRLPLGGATAKARRNICCGETVIAEAAPVPVSPVVIGPVPFLRTPVAAARGMRRAAARVAAAQATAAAMGRAGVAASRDEAASCYPALAGGVSRRPSMTARSRPVTAIEGTAPTGGVLPCLTNAATRPSGADGAGGHRETARAAA